MSCSIGYGPHCRDCEIESACPKPDKNELYAALDDLRAARTIFDETTGEAHEKAMEQLTDAENRYNTLLHIAKYPGLRKHALIGGR